MPLHLLWTHSMHCEHWIESLPTLLQQTAQGYLPDFLRTSWPTTEGKNMVFFMLTRIPLLCMSAWAWKYTSPVCPRGASGHQHREAPTAHQCRTMRERSTSSTRMWYSRGKKVLFIFWSIVFGLILHAHHLVMHPFFNYDIVTTMASHTYIKYHQK